VKQDPESLAVAVRTDIPDEDKAWGVMTTDRGGHYATDEDVADWQDLSARAKGGPAHLTSAAVSLGPGCRDRAGR
jgi:hypothetical protein